MNMIILSAIIIVVIITIISFQSNSQLEVCFDWSWLYWAIGQVIFPLISSFFFWNSFEWRNDEHVRRQYLIFVMDSGYLIVGYVVWWKLDCGMWMERCSLIYHEMFDILLGGSDSRVLNQERRYWVTHYSKESDWKPT